MFTSLLKIGLLSLISALFPFQEVDLSHLSTSIEEKVNIKKAFVNNDNDYLKIDYSDSNFLDGAEIGSLSSSGLS